MTHNSSPELWSVRITSIKIFNLASYVVIEPGALQALQIIEPDLHPNSHYWGGSRQSQDEKQSLSIYGLFQNLAHTTQGRTKLHNIILRPVSDMAIIETRQRAISLLLRPQNADQVRQIIATLTKIRNAKICASQLQRGIGFSLTRQSFSGSV